MSHYFVGVVIPKSTEFADLEATLEPILAPFEESYDEDTERHHGFWDWWSIGGRWTGVWSGYDPKEDPSNLNFECRLCAGTGIRTDFDPSGWPCNGCSGNGWHVKWPTEWVKHPGDIVPVSYLLDTPGLQIPYRIVVPDGPCVAKDEWNGEKYIKTCPPDEWPAYVKDLLNPYRTASIAVVDCHD